jgi:hypothetical protein
MRNKPKAVGVFKDGEKKVVIYAKKGESADEAITRVAENHNVPLSKVKRF